MILIFNLRFQCDNDVFVFYITQQIKRIFRLVPQIMCSAQGYEAWSHDFKLGLKFGGEQMGTPLWMLNSLKNSF